LYDLSSIPIRVRPSSRSIPSRASATTRVTIVVTARQDVRNSAATALLEVCAANQVA
jgi:hypothetical protein